MPIQFRKNSLRLAEYDYNTPGGYFITISVENMLPLFGTIQENLCQLNDAGIMIEQTLTETANSYSNLRIIVYSIMPNHIHILLHLLDTAESNKQSKYTAISQFVQSFKSKSTVEYIRGVKKFDWHTFNRRLWKRGYYDHIIRNDIDYQRIVTYIFNNPLAKWLELER